MPLPPGLDPSIPQIGGVASRLGPVVRPRAFDPDAPNLSGYDLRMIFRIVDRDTFEVLRELAVLGHVESYNRQPGVRLAVHPTAGGFTVDLPETDARGLEYHTMRGSSGVWPDGRGAGKPDGMAWLRALELFFAEILQPIVAGRPREQVELEWFNPDAPISGDDPAGDSLFVVVPHQSTVPTTRNARQASTYGWTVSLCAYKRRQASARELQRRAEAELGFYAKLLRGVQALNRYSFDQMFSRYQQTIAPFTQGVAAVGDVRHFLEGYAQGVNTFVAYNVNLFNDAVQELAALTVNLDETLGVNQGDRFGPDGPVLRAFENMRRDLTRTWAAVAQREGVRAPSLDGDDAIGPTAGTAAQGLRPPTALANTRARLGLPDLDRGTGRQALGALSLGARQAAVTPGATLDRLRPSGFTDIDLIRLNRLRWPYIDSSRTRPSDDPPPRPGDRWVAYLGETVLIPARHDAGGATGAADAVGGQLGADRDERIFGVDIYVDPETRALAWDPDVGDVRTIGGVPNLLQALWSCCVVPLGALHYAPDLGSHLHRESQGKWATDLQVRLNAVAAKRTLEQDPRVRSVDRVTVVARSGVFDVDFELTTIDGVPRGRLALTS